MKCTNIFCKHTVSVFTCESVSQRCCFWLLTLVSVQRWKKMDAADAAPVQFFFFFHSVFKVFLWFWAFSAHILCANFLGSMFRQCNLASFFHLRLCGQCPHSHYRWPRIPGATHLFYSTSNKWHCTWNLFAQGFTYESIFLNYQKTRVLKDIFLWVLLSNRNWSKTLPVIWKNLCFPYSWAKK